MEPGQHQPSNRSMVPLSGGVMVMTHDMSISARAAQLKDLLERSVVTDRNGAQNALEESITVFCDQLIEMRDSGRSLYLVGNGGSAGVAGHAATDFFNVAKIRAITLHESSLLTCMANDFGYENAFARMLGQMVKPGDVVITISSSGKSMNIRNAAMQATQNGGLVVTLSGFAEDNPLRSMGEINFWLDSCSYGLVEIGHQFILHNISDRFGLMS